MRPRIVVVMPAYNAGKKIESVYDGISRAVLSIIDQFIIVVDGATDDTLEKAKKIQRKFKKVTVEIHSKNKGYGEAQKTGLNKALALGAEACIIVHADGQMDTDKIPQLVEPILNGSADMVLGSRMLHTYPLGTAMPAYKYFGNKILTFFENLAFRSNISEFHTGYIAYSHKALKVINYRGLDSKFNFDSNMIIMALINNLRIKEVQVPTIYSDEKSHLNIINYSMDVFRIIRRYKQGYYHRLARKR